MGFDVPVPDPPSLHGPQSRETYDAVDNPADDPGDDVRREQLASLLAEGAWAAAFDEWADTTDLTAATLETVVDFGLVEEFDFYWDRGTDGVGYRAPAVTGEARSALSGEADDVENELDTLGRYVSEVLENDYLPRADEEFGFFADEEHDDAYEFRDE